MGPATTVDVCGAQADEDDGLFLFRVIAPASGSSSNGSITTSSSAGGPRVVVGAAAVGDGSGTEGESAEAAAAVARPVLDSGVVVLAEADATQRDIWMTYLQHAIATAKEAADAAAVASAQITESAASAGSGSSGSASGSGSAVAPGVASQGPVLATVSLAPAGNGARDAGNAIPMWSSFKTRQSKATLQVRTSAPPPLPPPFSPTTYPFV